MTISVEDATLVALTAAIKTTVGTVPVVSAPPEGQKPPLVLIGDLVLEDVGGKDGGLYQVSFQVAEFVAGSSRRAVYPLKQQVKDALLDVQLTLAGVIFSRPIMPSSDDRFDAQAGVAVASQSFELFVQLA